MNKKLQSIFNFFKSGKSNKKKINTKLDIKGFYLSNPKYEMKDVLQLLAHTIPHFNGMLIQGTEAAFSGVDENGNDRSKQIFRYINGAECPIEWVDQEKTKKENSSIIE